MRTFQYSLIFFACITCSSVVGIAQKRIVDSLTAVLKSEGEDTDKVNILNNLAAARYQKSPDSTILVASEAKVLAEKLNYNKGEANANRLMGLGYYRKDKYGQAMECYDKALKLYEELGNIRGQGTVLQYMGVIYIAKNDYLKALDYDLRALKIFEDVGNKIGQANTLGNIAWIYEDQGDYPKALDYDLRALKLDHEIANKDGEGSCDVNIGIIYEAQNDLVKAAEYQNLALEIFKTLGDKNSMGDCYGNLGSISTDKGDYSAAMDYLEKALSLHMEAGNRNHAANNLANIGRVYELRHDESKAIEYFFKSLGIKKEVADKSGIATAYADIANIYIEQNKYLPAREYLDSALEISRPLHEKANIGEIYRKRSVLDSAAGNPAIALADYKIYTAYRDSILNNENTKKELYLEYEQKKVAEKEEQNKKDARQKEEANKQQLIIYFIAGILVLVLAFVAFMIRSLQLSRRKTTIISKQKEEVDRLAIVARETGNIAIIMDADGRIEWANESFTRLNGISIADLKKLKGETIYDISNNPKIRDYVNTAVTERRSVVYESLNRNKEGSPLWESSTLTPIFDEQGKVRKLIIVDTDITERKEAQVIIEQKNKDITDSINYAKYLQEGILPPVSTIRNYFPESFVLYKPKDIVSGDFYWMGKDGDVILIAACDCTGHGVPGAMVSMVCSNAMNRALKEFKLHDTGRLLDKVREIVLETFAHSEGMIKDGMDVSFCAINLKTNEVEWSGANNPLWYIPAQSNGKGALVEIRGDKQPVGITERSAPFTTHTVKLNKGDQLYLFTDGFADQFGGPRGKKYKYAQLQEKLVSISSQPMQKQQAMLDEEFNQWKGNLEQVDDVLIIGIRV